MIKAEIVSGSLGCIQTKLLNESNLRIHTNALSESHKSILTDGENDE